MQPRDAVDLPSDGAPHLCVADLPAPAPLAIDPEVRAAAEAIADGVILGVEGSSGTILAVDAANEPALARLRLRLRRPHEPFCVIARSIEHAEEIAVLDPTARALLTSTERPVVLAPIRAGVLGVVLGPSVAPGLADVGVALASGAFEHELLACGPALLVMTRGAGVADRVVRDREVTPRHVLRSAAPRAIPIRRSGGLPETLPLPVRGPCVLGVGSHPRGAVCLARDGQALMASQFHGVELPTAERSFRDTVERLLDLAGSDPIAVAHDYHPDYASTQWAVASGLRRVAVQHHHAHVAACLAEHGRNERVTGIVFDGGGLGDDGQLWGGEVLRADFATSRRLGHLRPIALVGGESAVREPWRLAVAALVDAEMSLEVMPHVSPESRQRIAAMIATTPAVRTTAAGRWFDAVSALLGIAMRISYSGQAAAELDAFAEGDAAAPFDVAVIDHPGGNFEIDLRPTIRELVTGIRRGVDRRHLAARFHATMARAIVFASHRAALRTVVLTGGCFQNRRLLAEARRLLTADGFEVLSHERVPPSDGGLALGQAVVASHRLRS